LMGFPDGFRSGPGARKPVSRIRTSLYFHCPLTSSTPASVRRSTTAFGLPYGGSCAAQICARADPEMSSKEEANNNILAFVISIGPLSIGPLSAFTV